MTSLPRGKHRRPPIPWPCPASVTWATFSPGVSGRKLPRLPPLPPQPSWLSSLLLALSIMLYICCVIPVIAGEKDGVVMMFIMIAIATGLIVFRGTFLRTGSRKQTDGQESRDETPDDPKTKLRKSINALISTLCLVFYFIISFATMAWYITWVIFPLSAAIQNIVKACFDLKD